MPPRTNQITHSFATPVAKSIRIAYGNPNYSTNFNSIISIFKEPAIPEDILLYLSSLSLNKGYSDDFIYFIFPLFGSSYKDAIKYLKLNSYLVFER